MWIHTKFDGLGRDTLSVFNVLHSGIGSLRSPVKMKVKVPGPFEVVCVKFITRSVIYFDDVCN